MFFIALCFVWAGMILGISFLEAPVKFTAVPLDVGLRVGRAVFGAFNKVEMALAMVLLALVFSGKARLSTRLALGAAVLIVALQVAWLRPLLDARVQIIVDGGSPPESPYHWLYIVLELFKLVAVLAAGTMALRELRVGLSTQQ